MNGQRLHAEAIIWLPTGVRGLIHLLGREGAIAVVVLLATSRFLSRALHERTDPALIAVLVGVNIGLVAWASYAAWQRRRE